MAASLPSAAHTASPFDLNDERAYLRWRDTKLAHAAADIDALTVEVQDPRALTSAERGALLQRITQHNMAIYRSPVLDDDSGLVRALGAQLGLRQLDANWLADPGGISAIAVSAASDGRGGFIPYTDRAIRWHTDGYYHPAARRIHGMILHCVRPAASGGANALFDHELAYIALRDIAPAHVQALMQPDALTIPVRNGDAGDGGDGGVARPAQGGPVFSVDAADGSLHMRYTARTRSIEWKDDSATRAAVACLEALLASERPGLVRTRLQAGMGIVGHNVLHERSGFVDAAAAPRLLYRARYLDRVASGPAPWRNG